MALSADRTLNHEERARRGTGTAAGTAYMGSIVAVNAAGALIAAVDDASAGTCMGIAEAGFTSGNAGAFIYDCLFWLPIHSTDITAANIGDDCFAYDDAEVTMTSSRGPVVGQIRGINAAATYALVWVGVRATPHSTS